MDTNIVLAIVQIITVTATPIIVWVLGMKYQKRKAKNDAKMEVFLTLMANRRVDPISKEWVDSLNVIDVVFQDDANVRQAWKNYFESLHEKSPHYGSGNTFKISLLSEMAKSLGYKDLKQTEIDSTYYPQVFVERDKMQNELLTENLRVLKHSKSCAMSFSDEEFAKREANVKR